MKNSSKKLKTNFCCLLTLLPTPHQHWGGKCKFATLFLLVFICLIPIFQRQLGLICCIILLKKCVSLTMVATEMRKKTLFLVSQQHHILIAKRIKYLKNMNVTHSILHFTTTFHNFAFKIETSWAKRAAKPIFETRNVYDFCMYVVLFLT